MNTLDDQDVLAEDDWAELFTPEDRAHHRSGHVAMHGEFKLNMTTRLILVHLAGP